MATFVVANDDAGVRWVAVDGHVGMSAADDRRAAADERAGRSDDRETGNERFHIGSGDDE